MSPYANVLKKKKPTKVFLRVRINRFNANTCWGEMKCIPGVHSICMHMYTVYMYTSASYIFIRSSAWRCDRSASMVVLGMKTAIDIQSKQPAATLSDNSAQRRRLYVSPTNCRVTGQPLFWVWIWLIGSLLTQAFIMPNRQLTETRGRSWTWAQQ